MLYLMIKTDQPRAELYLYQGKRRLAVKTWEADRALGATLLKSIEALLNRRHLELADIEGIGVFSGPGSYTGLRIGHSVANTLVYALTIPLVGTSGPDWQVKAAESLSSGQNDRIALPKYGAPPRTTAPRK